MITRIYSARRKRPVTVWLLLLAAVACATVAAGSPWQATPEPTLQDLVVKLVRAPGVAGYEEAVREEVAAQLPDWAHDSGGPARRARLCDLRHH